MCFELTGGIVVVVVMLSPLDATGCLYLKLPMLESTAADKYIDWSIDLSMDCYHAGKVPVRIFFHVDYKPMAADGKALSRKVGKDDITGNLL